MKNALFKVSYTYVFYPVLISLFVYYQHPGNTVSILLKQNELEIKDILVASYWPGVV